MGTINAYVLATPAHGQGDTHKVTNAPNFTVQNEISLQQIPSRLPVWKKHTSST